MARLRALREAVVRGAHVLGLAHDDVAQTRVALAMDSREEFSRLKSKLSELGPVTPEAAVLAQIEILKTDRRWELTAACTDATLTESRRFCAQYRQRQAELARSREALRLERALEDLRITMAGTGADAGSVEGDWITGFVTRLSGFGDTLVRDAYALLAALAIELVAALSFPAATRLSMRMPLKATERARDGQEVTAAPISSPQRPTRLQRRFLSQCAPLEILLSSPRLVSTTSPVPRSC